MKQKMQLLLFAFMMCANSRQGQTQTFGEGEMKISIEQGEAWLHDFPLFWGFKVKNAPQIAIWVEDTDGNYLKTIYVTRRIATQNWRAAKGDRRKEALPQWCYQRGIKAADGLYLPTKEQPVTDAITGATPRTGFTVQTPAQTLNHYVVKIEINHSTDFNEAYPKDAREGEPNYSGGTGGSGQPALVYAADIDVLSGEKSFKAQLIGHSSPDGIDGGIYTDLSGFTTALQIVKSITVTLE